MKWAFRGNDCAMSPICYAIHITTHTTSSSTEYLPAYSHGSGLYPITMANCALILCFVHLVIQTLNRSYAHCFRKTVRIQLLTSAKNPYPVSCTAFVDQWHLRIQMVEIHYYDVIWYVMTSYGMLWCHMVCYDVTVTYLVHPSSTQGCHVPVRDPGGGGGPTHMTECWLL